MPCRFILVHKVLKTVWICYQVWDFLFFTTFLLNLFFNWFALRTLKFRKFLSRRKKLHFFYTIRSLSWLYPAYNFLPVFIKVTEIQNLNLWKMFELCFFFIMIERSFHLLNYWNVLLYLFIFKKHCCSFLSVKWTPTAFFRRLVFFRVVYIFYCGFLGSKNAFWICKTFQYHWVCEALFILGDLGFRSFGLEKFLDSLMFDSQHFCRLWTDFLSQFKNTLFLWRIFTDFNAHLRFALLIERQRAFLNQGYLGCVQNQT